MKNYESLLVKIAESAEEFKQNLRCNEFEKSLTDYMNQYLAEHIQEVLETLMHDKWIMSVLCSVAGKRCLSFEGHRLVTVSVLNDRRILISALYFYNRVKEKKRGRKKQGRSKGNNIDCYLGLRKIGMVGSYSGRLASEICTMALLSPSEDMAVRLLSERGNIDKDFKPVYDATIQGKDYAFGLFETYLDAMDTSKISRVVFIGDGAPWIWSRAEELFVRHFPNKETWQVLDYTHAKQALEEILDLLPARCKEADKIRKIFKDALWKGEIETMEKLIRINFPGKCREKALNKWSNYFHTNSKRMQYSLFKNEGLPQGSGSVESAIRRVINLRL